MSTNNAEYKGKDWGDIIYTPQPLDESEVLNYLQNCSHVERRMLSRVLGNHDCNPIARTISVKDMKVPSFQDRFVYTVSDEDLKNQNNFPIEVIYSFESEAYITIKGRRYFQEGKQRGIKKFTCAIIGEVQYDYEAFIPRLSHVLTDHKPFHILEKAKCIFETKKLIIPKYGAEKLFGKGGDRRSKNLQKFSLIELLKKELPLKLYQIDTLKRFADNIGPFAIEALYGLLKNKGEELSIYRVHRMNPTMREMGLRAQIDVKVKAMENNGSDPDEIREAVAIMVYDVLFEQEKPSKQKKPTVNSPGSGNQSDHNDRKQENADKKTTRKREEYVDIGSTDFKAIKQAFNNFAKKVPNIQKFMKSKKELTADETQKIHQMGEELQDSFQNFWVPFLSEGTMD